MSRLHMAALSDTGRVRPENEDAVATTAEIGLAVLADGMGGHQAGEVASSMAVEIVTRHLVDTIARVPEDARDAETLEPQSMERAIGLANGAIFEMSRTRPEYNGMGSTIVVALFHGDKVFFAHVGDSRLYRLRDGVLTQMTEDHSFVQELVSRGLLTREEARHSINKNLVTRALGVGETVAATVAEAPLRPQDLYLLCSDGLSDVLSDEDMGRILIDHGDDLEVAAQRMVDAANDRGSPDNVSVILARSRGPCDWDQKAIQRLWSFQNASARIT